MPAPTEGEEPLCAARIPADVGQPDRVLAGLTARQVCFLAVTGVVVWLGYQAACRFMAPLAYLALAAPIAAVTVALALGRRDGISMDRFALAALRHARSAKRRVNAPEGIPPLPGIVPAAWAEQAGAAPAVLSLPARQVLHCGVVDLGRDGHAALAVCSTVNFDLRTTAEQHALTSGFARWLNSLTGPTQILIRAHRLDLTPLIDHLLNAAPGLPHPALERAAVAHADFLRELAAHSDLLTRHVLLVAREPTTTRSRGAVSGPARARQRIDEATHALAAAQITTTPLDTDATTRAINQATSTQTTPPNRTAHPHKNAETEGGAAWASQR